MPQQRLVWAVLVLLLALSSVEPQPAGAVPAFAHRYGVSCQACHTIVPELNPFGQAFRDAGYRWPVAVAEHGTLPVTMKTNLAYTSAPDPTGLPKAIVDEVEFLSFGPVGKNFSYRVEQYVVDGGNVGKTRDAFVEYRSNPLNAWHGFVRPIVGLQLGQFTLPLPNDPETMRPTENHYQLYDQTVGNNPFNFFDDRIGAHLYYQNSFAEFHAMALKGHDAQSGLAATGTDTMFAIRVGPPAISLWGYQYQGIRPLEPMQDAFIRRGLGLTSTLGKSQASLVLQNGNDSSPFGLGIATGSSGGYLQEEWTFSNRWIGTVRYDGFNGPNGFLRSATASLSYRPVDRFRLTLEDVVQTQPQTMHTLNAAILFAY
jgi:hypothetical protein